MTDHIPQAFERLLSWCIVMVFAFSGCGTSLPEPARPFPKTKVQGVVSLGPLPLPKPCGGWVTFFPIDGTLGDPATARLKPDGSYSIEDAPVGLVQIRVELKKATLSQLPRQVADALQVYRTPGTPLKFTTRPQTVNECPVVLLRQ
jgi:hypothetical protein